MRWFSSYLFLLVTLAFAADALPQRCECRTCNNRSAYQGPQWTRYWNDLRQSVRDHNANSLSRNFPGNTQIVFLDYETGEDSSFIYTQFERDQIQANMEEIYAGFQIAFTQSLPTGEFSTIVFNSGPTGGLAEDIDFRNLNKNDSAVMNADGLGLTSEQIVVFSSNIASHELGHLLGLRHGDSFGPIGEGVLVPFASFFEPEYLGPELASETFDHIMATPGLGVPLSVFTDSLNWLSERSSSKIGFADDGLAIDDLESNDTFEAAQQLELQTLALPNKIQSGINAGLGDLSFSATAVVGSLAASVDPVDIFRVDARAGDVFTIEVISNTVDRLSLDPIDPNIGAFDIDGNFIDYYSTIAFNEHEFESTLDCNLVDLIVPRDGPVFFQVDNTFTTDSGLYELWIYRFNGIHGDVNGDGDINLLDVEPFVESLLSSNFNPRADIDLNGMVNLLDVDPFLALLLEN